MSMNFPDGINLPLTYGPKDAKSLIIRMLSKEFPLSAKQVFLRIRKEEPTAKLTYAAVHKALRILQEQRIVAKDDSGAYSLSVAWIEQLKTFGEKIGEFYSNKKRTNFLDLKEGESAVVEFDGIIIESFYWFINQLFQVVMSSPERIVCCAQLKRGWAVTTVVSDREYSQMKLLFKKCPIYILSNSALPVDKYIMRLWEDHFGAKTKMGVPCAFVADRFCIGDFVCELFIDPDAEKEWASIWSDVKSSDDIPLAISRKTKLHFGKVGKSKLIVTRDAYMSSMLKAETMKYFR